MASPQIERFTPVPVALPKIASGVTVSTLRRVWFATPARERSQGRSMIESSVLVTRDGHPTEVKLVDLTLPEVEARIGAVAPRYVVRFHQVGLIGVQATTFVNRSDAVTFATGKRFHGKPACVLELF